MVTAIWIFFGCCLFLHFCSFVPSTGAFKNDFGAEHSFEARTSLPKQERNEQPAALFLFVGVLSTLHSSDRRDFIRNTWGTVARKHPLVDFRFFLEDPDKDASRQELKQHTDLAYVPTISNYRTAVIKTYFVLEYAYTHFECEFIMKVDEDTFVNVQPLVQELQSICDNEETDCRRSRLYIGSISTAGSIKALDTEDGKPTKYYNEPFFKRVGLEYYPHYMVGGGYIVTADIAAALVAVNSHVGLSVFHLEDANFGFWLSPWDVHYINHPQFDARTGTVVEQTHSNGSNILSLRADLAASNDFCSDHPWLMLHKVIGEGMEFIMSLIDKCTKRAQ